MILDYKKLEGNTHVKVWGGPSGGTTLGITKIAVPEAAELNGGASGMISVSQSISWNDTELVGVSESEELNEPSLEDAASYVEFGTTNIAGSHSYFMPREYDDNSNLHSLVYDLTDTMREVLDFAVRIDGAKPATQAAANGDYVSTTRAMAMSESNPFTPGESVRRTVGYIGKGGFAHYTIVGPHTLTAAPKATTPWKAGSKGRLRVTVGGRDYTNAVRFSTSNVAVVDILPGGFYTVKGTTGGTATITITDEGAGTSTTQAVAVTA